MRDVIRRIFPDVPVISYDEIADGVEVRSVGTIGLPDGGLALATAGEPGAPFVPRGRAPE